MKRGFTLIEISLALLVVVVGFVATTGLLSSTLGSGTRSRDDMSITSFAEMVLNDFQAQTDWAAIPTTGALALRDYSGADIQLPLGSENVFDVTAPGVDGETRQRFAVTYLLDLHAEGRTKTLTLRVWPGRLAKGRPRQFRAASYNWNNRHATKTP